MKLTRVMSVALAVAGFAATNAGAGVKLNDRQDVAEAVKRLKADGWREVAPGVLERRKGNERVERLSIGPQGLTRALKELRARHNALVKQNRKNPSAKLRKALVDLKRSIRDLEDASAVPQVAGQSPTLSSGCDVAFGCNANAYPLRGWGGGGGVGADSSSYFWNNCGYQGNVYADAQGQTDSSYQFSSNYDSGENVSTSAAVNVPGGPPCFSDAYSYTYVPDLGLLHQCYSYNDQCGAPEPLFAWISGPSEVYVYGYDCETVTWYASAFGGTPPYRFFWSDGSSGDATSQTFCGRGYYDTEYVNVEVKVLDDGGQSAWAGFSTTVYYLGDIYPPEKALKR